MQCVSHLAIEYISCHACRFVDTKMCFLKINIVIIMNVSDFHMYLYIVMMKCSELG